MTDRKSKSPSIGCKHYHSEKDIVAIKFKCCGKFYACIYCHNESENHEVKKWKEEERDELAIRCSKCESIFSINEYLNSNNNCPNCTAAFNPKCSNHYHYYFEGFDEGATN